MITIKNVEYSFDSLKVLDGVDLTILQGEFVFLIGATGVGKSTLLRLIYMDLFPQAGEVEVGDYSSSTIRRRQIPYLRRKIGVVFQDFKLFEDRSVFENVAFALHVTGSRKSTIKKRVLRVLADVGLSHKRNSFPHEISGGEKQRVAIARALVNEPFILLADEPTGNLDPESAAEIMQTLEEINNHGTAVLMATHNYELIKKLRARVVQLKDGKLSEMTM
ncbi:MAG: cell division ATP-binding protein FtsE [Bacteroidota bacterium]